MAAPGSTWQHLAVVDPPTRETPDLDPHSSSGCSGLHARLGPHHFNDQIKPPTHIRCSHLDDLHILTRLRNEEAALTLDARSRARSWIHRLHFLRHHYTYLYSYLYRTSKAT